VSNVRDAGLWLNISNSPVKIVQSNQEAREAGTTIIENKYCLYQIVAREAGETKTSIVH